MGKVATHFVCGHQTLKVFIWLETLRIGMNIKFPWYVMKVAYGKYLQSYLRKETFTNITLSEVAAKKFWKLIRWQFILKNVRVQELLCEHFLKRNGKMAYGWPAESAGDFSLDQ